MSFIGKPVYKVWATNSLRFGKVVEEKTKDNRKYVKVDWKDDEAYERDAARVIKLRNVKHDEEYEWHRIDNVKVFNPSTMISTISKLCWEL